MRLVFFGSGEFGVPTLRTLVGRGHSIVAAVTQPERPAGRGGKCRPTPIQIAAESLGIPILDPEKPNTPEFEAELARLSPDLAVVVAYGHLIKKALLAVPRLGFINLHASILPAYRGAAPVPWAILKGETVSGATVFQLNERFDSGAVLAVAELPIASDDTAGSYLEKLAPIGAVLMAGVVAELACENAVPRPQDHGLASLAPKLRKEDGRIDWTRTREEIERQIRAFQPWPQAFTLLSTAKGQVRINVAALEPVGTAGVAVGPPGTIVAADVKAGLVVMTANGPVRLSCIQPEGKRPMSDREYLRGSKIER